MARTLENLWANQKQVTKPNATMSLHSGSRRSAPIPMPIDNLSDDLEDQSMESDDQSGSVDLIESPEMSESDLLEDNLNDPPPPDDCMFRAIYSLEQLREELPSYQSQSLPELISILQLLEAHLKSALITVRKKSQESSRTLVSEISVSNKDKEPTLKSAASSSKRQRTSKDLPKNSLPTMLDIQEVSKPYSRNLQPKTTPMKRGLSMSSGDHLTPAKQPGLTRTQTMKEVSGVPHPLLREKAGSEVIHHTEEKKQSPSKTMQEKTDALACRPFSKLQTTGNAQSNTKEDIATLDQGESSSLQTAPLANGIQMPLELNNQQSDDELQVLSTPETDFQMTTVKNGISQKNKLKKAKRPKGG